MANRTEHAKRYEWADTVSEYLKEVADPSEVLLKNIRKVLYAALDLSEPLEQKDVDAAFFALRQASLAVSDRLCFCEKCTATRPVTGALCDAMVVSEEPGVAEAISKLAVRYGVGAEVLLHLQAAVDANPAQKREDLH